MQNRVPNEGQLTAKDRCACGKVKKTILKDVISDRVAVKHKTSEDIYGDFCLFAPLQPYCVFNSPEVPRGRVVRGEELVPSVPVTLGPVCFHDVRKGLPLKTCDPYIHVPRRP